MYKEIEKKKKFNSSPINRENKYLIKSFSLCEKIRVLNILIIYLKISQECNAISRSYDYTKENSFIKDRLNAKMLNRNCFNEPKQMKQNCFIFLLSF